MRTGRLVGIITATAALAVGAIAMAGCSSPTTTSSSSAPAAGAASAPTAAASQASGQVLPVSTNPIVNTATKPGLEIKNIMVENNVDPATQQALSDQLQMNLTNTSTATQTGLEMYYLMTDSTTGKTEGYYQKLAGLTLAPGETRTIFFDGGSGNGHYPENQYSLYRTSKNEVVIDVQASAPGFAPATAQVKKAVGTGEKAGE